VFTAIIALAIYLAVKLSKTLARVNILRGEIAELDKELAQEKISLSLCQSASQQNMQKSDERIQSMAEQIEQTRIDERTQGESRYTLLKNDYDKLLVESSRNLEERTAAQTRIHDLEELVASLKDERDRANHAQDQALRDAADARKKTEIAYLKLEEGEKRMKDWELQQTESLKAARASILEVSGQVSNQLVENHNREQEKSRKENAEMTRQTTEKLHQQFTTVLTAVSTLGSQVQETREKSNIVWKALTSPLEAGQYAEIGLENTLKSFGLEPVRDFVMQYTIRDDQEKTNLRPDAVVFLPSGMIMVIDSKASRLFLEASEEEAENNDSASSMDALKRSMNEHLKGLTRKDYRNAIEKIYASTGRKGEIRRILSVMYLPSEAIVEKLCRADKEIAAKAAREEIIITGPTGLASLVSFSRVEIDNSLRAENQEKIVEMTYDLLESVAVALGHAEQVGRGIRKASECFDSFARSVNTRLLPKGRAINKLGVRRTGSHKALPFKIGSNKEDDYLIAEMIQEGIPDGVNADGEPEAITEMMDTFSSPNTSKNSIRKKAPEDA
jgi:DNA recombination protein RmuC